MDVIDVFMSEASPSPLLALLLALTLALLLALTLA